MAKKARDPSVLVQTVHEISRMARNDKQEYHPSRDNDREVGSRSKLRFGFQSTIRSRATHGRGKPGMTKKAGVKNANYKSIQNYNWCHFDRVQVVGGRVEKSSLDDLSTPFHFARDDNY